MEIKIVEPVVSKKYKDVFVAEADFMHGDAHNSTTVEYVLGGFDEVYSLWQFDNAWWATIKQEREEMVDDHHADLMQMPGFADVFGTTDKWPEDETCLEYCPGILAYYMGYNLFWYDAAGTKFYVELVGGDNG